MLGKPSSDIEFYLKFSDHHAMIDRYFLDPNGAITRRRQGKPGDGHHEIGTEHLAANGIVPADYNDVYRQMFRLGFVRVVEHDDGVTVEIEHGPELTAAQQRVIDGLRQARKRIVQVRAKFD